MKVLHSAACCKDSGKIILTIEFEEDEYRLLRRYSKMLKRDMYDILRDAINLAIAKNIEILGFIDKG